MVVERFHLKMLKGVGSIMSLVSPALAGMFFTTSATWKDRG